MLTTTSFAAPGFSLFGGVAQEPPTGEVSGGEAVGEEMATAVERLVQLDPQLQGWLIQSILLILVLMVLRYAALRVVRSSTDDIRARYRWRKTITYTTVVLGILLVGRVWYEGIANLATFLGLVSAGLAIALRDPIVNLGGWLFIIWRRPFVVGDRIQIGEHAGDVIDQRVFQIIVLEIGNWVDADQSTGRIIHIPNGLVFREPLANSTRGLQFVWDELAVLVTFESDWRKAKELLLEIVNRHGRAVTEEAEQQMLNVSRQYLIFYSTLTPTVYTAVKDSGVRLTLRYLCHPRRRRGMAQAIWEDILAEFARAEDIDFAYPTIRYYDNVAEGKPGTAPAGP
jgi:small-conductance mechanosensitive channel